MNYEEFLKAVDSLNARWELVNGGKIRCEGRCPIEAVAGLRPGTLSRAMEQLQLDHFLTSGIIYSADNHAYSKTDMRADLLKACKLPCP